MRKPRINNKLSRSVKYIEQLHAELNKANSGLLTLTMEMEARIARRTGQLESVNEELESFGYSVSHDLRQPLRVIEGFSQALLEEYQDKLDDVGLDYLVRICRGTRRMADLIDDLLALRAADYASRSAGVPREWLETEARIRAEIGRGPEPCLAVSGSDVIRELGVFILRAVSITYPLTQRIVRLHRHPIGAERIASR